MRIVTDAFTLLDLVFRFVRQDQIVIVVLFRECRYLNVFPAQRTIVCIPSHQAIQQHQPNDNTKPKCNFDGSCSI